MGNEPIAQGNGPVVLVKWGIQRPEGAKALTLDVMLFPFRANLLSRYT